MFRDAATPGTPVAISFPSGVNNYLFAEKVLGPGDFRVRVDLTILRLSKSAASLVIGTSHFGFEGGTGETFVAGLVTLITWYGSHVLTDVLNRSSGVSAWKPARTCSRSP